MKSLSTEVQRLCRNLKGIKGREVSFIFAQQRSQGALVEQIIFTTHVSSTLEMLSVVVVALALSVLQAPFSESIELQDRISIASVLITIKMHWHNLVIVRAHSL